MHGTRKITRGRPKAEAKCSSIVSKRPSGEDEEFDKFVELHKKRRVEEQEKLVTMQTQIDRKSREIEDVRARNRELNLEIIAQHKRKSLENAKLKQELEVAKRNSGASTEDHARLQKSIDQLREENARLAAQNEEQKTRLMVVRMNLGAVEADLGEVREQCAREKEELRRAKAEKAALEKERDELIEKADDFQTEMVELKKVNARSCTENARLFAEIAALRPGSQASRTFIKTEPF